MLMNTVVEPRLLVMVLGARVGCDTFLSMVDKVFKAWSGRVGSEGLVEAMVKWVDGELVDSAGREMFDEGSGGGFKEIVRVWVMNMGKIVGDEGVREFCARHPELFG
jgi:hypothetical protein